MVLFASRKAEVNVKQLDIPASAGTAEERLEAICGVASSMGGLYGPSHSAVELRMAAAALSGIDNVLSPGTCWAMNFNDYVTASAVADDGHTMAVAVDGSGTDTPGCKVVLLPSNRVVRDGLSRVIGLQFAAGEDKPSYLGFDRGKEVWFVCVSGREFVLDSDTAIDAKSVVLEVTRTRVDNVVVSIVQSRPSWYFKVEDDQLRMTGYSVHLLTRFEGYAIQRNTLQLMQSVGACLFSGRSRVIAAASEQIGREGRPENTIFYNVSTGEQLWTEQDFLMKDVDVLTDTEHGVLVHGHDGEGHLVVVAFDGTTSTRFPTCLSRDEFVRSVACDNALLLQFRDGDMLVVTDEEAVWHTHKHIECVVPASHGEGFVGCTRRECDGRLAACSVFTITL